MMFQLRRFLTLTSSAVLISFSAMAGEGEDALIAKVVKAYGGDALLKARTLRVDETSKIFNIGQSANPEMLDIATVKTSMAIDYVKQRISIENWNRNRGGTFLNQGVFDGKTGKTYNHLAKTWGENANLTFYAVGGGNMRTLGSGPINL